MNPANPPDDRLGAKPLPVTVTRPLADGTSESFVIADPPPRFRIDWATRTAVPVEPAETRRRFVDRRRG